MLSPEKYMDLDKSILMVTSIVLKRMRRDKILKTDILLSYVQNKVGDEIQETFLSALTLLYALGKIDYLDKNDTLYLVD